MPQAATPNTQDSPAERQIARAKSLEKDRAELQKKIDANRRYLRLMEQNDELTTAQADWLDDFYPVKEKGERRSRDDIERTRKAKEDARKG